MVIDHLFMYLLDNCISLSFGKMKKCPKEKCSLSFFLIQYYLETIDMKHCENLDFLGGSGSKEFDRNAGVPGSIPG